MIDGLRQREQPSALARFGADPLSLALFGWARGSKMPATVATSVSTVSRKRDSELRLCSTHLMRPLTSANRDGGGLMIFIEDRPLN